jgi:hypothetical protein
MVCPVQSVSGVNLPKYQQKVKPTRSPAPTLVL